MKITLGLDYPTMRANLRGYYTGRGWYQALRMMDIAAEHHTGVRKNGEPEFSHQVFQAQAARALDMMFLDPEGTHITILGHDLPEDHDYSLKLVERDFGHERMVSIERMTNVTEAKVEKPDSVYYDQIGIDVRASLAKGFDRCHNIMSMLDAFTVEKQTRYIATTRDHIVPMLKRSRKLFPAQEPVYQNIKINLLSMMVAIEKVRAGSNG